MKIRTDFVTNSSSSSFIIVGKNVTLNEVNLESGKYYFLGQELCDGTDIIEVDEDILEFLKKASQNHWGDMYLGDTCFNLVKSYTERWEDDCENFTIKELKDYLKDDDEFEIISLEKDYHGSENVNDLKERYL